MVFYPMDTARCVWMVSHVWQDKTPALFMVQIPVPWGITALIYSVCPFCLDLQCVPPLILKFYPPSFPASYATSHSNKEEEKYFMQYIILMLNYNGRLALFTETPIEILKMSEPWEFITLYHEDFEAKP